MVESEGLQPRSAGLDMLPPSSIIPLSLASSQSDTPFPQEYDPLCASSSLTTSQPQPPDRFPLAQPRRLALPITPSFAQGSQEASGVQQANNGSTTITTNCKSLETGDGIAPSLFPTSTTAPLTGEEIPAHPGHTFRRESHQVCADMVGIISMSRTSGVSPGRLRETIERRAETLRDISSDAVHDTLAGLLNAPPDAPPFHDLALLSQTLGCEPYLSDTMVDDESNPWSEYILLFIDTLLVLYRPVATDPIALLHGYGESGENDEMDQAAFGASTATALGSRVLFLIPHAHHHAIKALWFALIYLSIAYFGSERGVTCDFLLGQIDEEWSDRERYAARMGKPCWSEHPWENGVEAEWPAKKRCQFRVVYNIPSVAKPASEESSAPPAESDGQTPESGPAPVTMTANPTQCPSAALKIVGECPHCQKAFCGSHRTPESHNCVGIQACRDAAFQANKERLERERTTASKIAQA
ncbi:hypothetical protein DB88DRAFT_508001 [Papiliotrema laurentii]|uniref:AN1-type domain-containing protein n=1 Tax=Papiliotrema laurentii TaxID=5418 RepID=A0AAD9FXP6_PAPLA|nr:hypothetical protein DB88DRAFT_508001 [Papiliotrema laurentii]